MKIALLSCTKVKHTEPCTAVRMYMPSQLFSKAFTYVDQQDYDEIFILSAKYGLLNLGEEIAPYNQTLITMPADEVKKWSHNVALKLKQTIYNKAHVDFYAGEYYRKYLIPLLEQFGMTCSVPLKGMGIGEQLSFYKRHIQ